MVSASGQKGHTPSTHMSIHQTQAHGPSQLQGTAGVHMDVL